MFGQPAIHFSYRLNFYFFCVYIQIISHILLFCSSPGYYFSSRLLSGSRTRHDLHAPEETLTVNACLIFYYSFHGSGELEIFDNGVSMLKIRPNRIDTWQKSQIQLSQGKHNITFSHIKGNTFISRRINILALDSIAISNGTCGFFGKYILFTIFLNLSTGFLSFAFFCNAIISLKYFQSRHQSLKRNYMYCSYSSVWCVQGKTV